MLINLISWSLLLHCTLAIWSTLYSFEDGRIYMLLKNDQLVSLNVSLYGANILSQTLNQNTQLQQLPSPPANSSLFVHSTNLYAFAANSLTRSAGGTCSDGQFQLYYLNDTSNSWMPQGGLSYSGVLDDSFYKDATYFVSPGSSDVYIYGGRCSTGSVSQRLLSFNMDTKTFFNVTTPTRPLPFYGAVSLWAPNPQASVVIGGKSPYGWLNMYQLATWSFQSGWLFQEAAQSGLTTIDSRTSPLVLPIFSPSSATSAQSFLSTYAPTAALVVGGDSDVPLQTEWAQISFGNQKWTWSRLLPSIDALNLLGGFVVFNTFVAVNSTSKRDDGYSLNLYDLSDNFRPITDLKSSQMLQKQSKTSSSGKIVKILVGVLVPVVVTAILSVAGMYLWKRKASMSEQQSILEATDYQFGHFRNALDQPYSIMGHRPLDLYINQNDSNSTLDNNSIDLWVRKRQEYEASRYRGGIRHSYLASNETLTTHSDFDTVEEVLSEKQSHERTSDDLPSIKSLTTLPVHFHESTRGCLEENLPQGARLARFKTQSFSKTPPGLPMLTKKSILDPGHIQLEEPTDCESIETNMDVQVLVSSKRKSTLRVMNPDQDATVRQRQPS